MITKIVQNYWHAKRNNDENISNLGIKKKKKTMRDKVKENKQNLEWKLILNNLPQANI